MSGCSRSHSSQLVSRNGYSCEALAFHRARNSLETRLLPASPRLDVLKTSLPPTTPAFSMTRRRPRASALNTRAVLQ